MPEEIAGLCQEYWDEFCQLKRERKPLDGAFGFGGGPKEYPCHEKFARNLEQLLKQFAARAPASGQIRQLLNDLYFTAPARCEEEPTVYWMLLAAQGMTLELVEMLDPQDARVLYSAYQAAYPRRKRLPAQNRLFDALRGRCEER